MNKVSTRILRRRSIRLKGYDYSKKGLYYIIICCDHWQELFGEIINGQMILSDGGRVADECWQAIPQHFPNAILHEYIIMPDHVHGIVELTEGVENLPPVQEDIPSFQEDIPSFQEDIPSIQEDIPSIQEDIPAFQEYIPVEYPKSQFPKKHAYGQMIPRSIGSIVKGFKIGVTKWFRQNTEVKKVWQVNFYESVIRNQLAYNTISQYIKENPEKWSKDKSRKFSK